MVHSSAATVGLVMILGQAGLLDLKSAIYLMLGDNIGTCVTAQVASLTGNANARRTAWGHTLYNVFGVILTWIALPIFMKIVIWATEYFHTNPDISVYIANSHTILNLLSAVIFLPITKYYVSFLNKIVRSKAEKVNGKALLNKLLLDKPVASLSSQK